MDRLPYDKRKKKYFRVIEETYEDYSEGELVDLIALPEGGLGFTGVIVEPEPELDNPVFRIQAYLPDYESDMLEMLISTIRGESGSFMLKAILLDLYAGNPDPWDWHTVLESIPYDAPAETVKSLIEQYVPGAVVEKVERVPEGFRILSNLFFETFEYDITCIVTGPTGEKLESLCAFILYPFNSGTAQPPHYSDDKGFLEIEVEQNSYGIAGETSAGYFISNLVKADENKVYDIKMLLGGGLM